MDRFDASPHHVWSAGHHWPTSSTRASQVSCTLAGTSLAFSMVKPAGLLSFTAAPTGAASSSASTMPAHRLVATFASPWKSSRH